MCELSWFNPESTYKKREYDMVKCLLIDLEGTVFFKGKPINGAIETITYLRNKNIPFLFLTNTDSKTSSNIAKQLQGMGFDISSEEIFTPATALSVFIKENQANVHYLLSKEIQDTLPAYKPDIPINYVALGDFRKKVSYDVINEAFRHLMDGAELLVLQKGKFFIRDNGYNIDTGAFAAMLEYGSGKKSQLLGKPSKHFFKLGCKKLGIEPQDALIIGDDITADIQGAINIGATSILVKTGKYALQKKESTQPVADYTIASFADVPSLKKHGDGSMFLI